MHVGRHNRVPRNPGSEASRAPHERGTPSGKGTGAEDHHGVGLGFIAMLVFPALDYRFGWSPVPASVAVLGDALIALGFLFTFFVFKENSYGASTIQIAEDQTVISTGPYAFVRHPMYAAALVMLLGIPLALGSWWGLFVLVLVLPVLIWRLLDEERFLRQNLPGYPEYQVKVKYRLLPFVW